MTARDDYFEHLRGTFIRANGRPPNNIGELTAWAALRGVSVPSFLNAQPAQWAEGARRAVPVKASPASRLADLRATVVLKPGELVSARPLPESDEVLFARAFGVPVALLVGGFAAAGIISYAPAALARVAAGGRVPSAVQTTLSGGKLAVQTTAAGGLLGILQRQQIPLLGASVLGTGSFLLQAGTQVEGTNLFLAFIMEETLQALAFSVSISLKTKNPDAATAANAKFFVGIGAAKDWLDKAKKIGGFLIEPFNKYVEAAEEAHAAYARAIESLRAEIAGRAVRKLEKTAREIDELAVEAAKTALAQGNFKEARALAEAIEDSGERAKVQTQITRGETRLGKALQREGERRRKAQERDDARKLKAQVLQAKAEEREAKRIAREELRALQAAEKEAARARKQAAKEKRDALKAFDSQAKAEIKAKAKEFSDYLQQYEGLAKAEAERQAEIYRRQLTAAKAAERKILEGVLDGD